MTSGDESIRIEESADLGVIVAALEIVEAGFGIVDIAPVAQGVVGSQGAGHGTGGAEDVAPGIISVGYDSCSGDVQDRRYITLEVGGVVVSGAVVDHGQRCAAGIVGKGQGVAAHGHLTQLAAIVDIAVRGAAVGPFGPHAVGIVGEGPSGASTGHSGQLPAMLPGIGPGAVAEDVANGITGYSATVIGGKQIAPVGIAVAVGLGGGGSA